MTQLFYKHEYMVEILENRVHIMIAILIANAVHIRYFRMNHTPYIWCKFEPLTLVDLAFLFHLFE